MPCTAAAVCLNALKRLADHHRPLADRLVVAWLCKIAIRVAGDEHGLALGGGGAWTGGGGRSRGLDLHGEQGAGGAQTDRLTGFDGDGLDAPAVDEDAVRAERVTEQPVAVLERHRGMVPAHRASSMRTSQSWSRPM